MKLPKSLNNRLSIVGAIVAATSLLMIVFFFLLSLFYQQSSSYLGLFTFIILPVFLILGLVLIPIGMIARNRRIKKHGIEAAQKAWVIDFNDRRHRNATIIFAVGTIVLLFLSGVGSYEAFHYTESVQFCGTMCHQVMEPEYTAYQGSAHSRVACVECHVGPGAGWYVKSKLSGLRQVWAVITNSYPTPIPTPIQDLRPARETCEECHWPEKFYSHKLVHEKSYLADEANTEWNIDLRMRLGASHSALGITEGIHWHIHPDVKIEYIQGDEKRETIPWVRYIDMATGDTIVYVDEEMPLEDSVMQSAEIRTMDCMDCHTRPSHSYHPPQQFIDEGLAAGIIPVDLPEIKRVGLEILNQQWESKELVQDTLRKHLMAFYESSYPDVFESRQADIEKASEGMMAGYSRNVFPKMKVTWDAYPDHIGHMEFNGCFRCHNDRHINDDGRVISKDCNLCHNILTQGGTDSLEVAPFNSFLEFRHPVDIDEAWREMNCADCHRQLY